MPAPRAISSMETSCSDFVSSRRSNASRIARSRSSPLIVGAGISGIGAAFHLQDKCPDRSYAILEMRESMGGTWDLFRYPGIRSDSDMLTLGYTFRPWAENQTLADGPSILRYVKETAREHDVE